MANLHDLPPAARAFLDDLRFAVLATVDGAGAPQQSVMWYLIDGDAILFNTKRGRLKEQHLQQDQRVALCIADGYRYITIRDVAEEIADQATAQADIQRLATRYYGAEKAEKSGAHFREEARVSYRVPLDNVIAYGFGG